jgi:hypothetical protein
MKSTASCLCFKLNTGSIHFKDKSRKTTYTMPLSVLVRLGVSATIGLEYETIDTIQSLFKKRTSVFIYGIGNSPIDYLEHDECFDADIFDLLTGLNSKEEFNAKLATIAELRTDECVRRKSDAEEGDAAYSPFNLDDVSFEFFDHCSSISADFDYDSKTSYDSVGSAHNFMERIKESVEYFKKLGFDEKNINIKNYNISNT